MDIYNLDQKINLLYNYLYDNDNNNYEFIIDKINLGKINLDDIKIKLPEENDMQEYINFYNINKSDILLGKFKIIDFNKDLYELYLKKYYNQFPITIKINFYKNKNLINNLESPINNDSLFSYLLSQLIIEKKTKHILLPIINLDIKFEDIEKILLNDSSYSVIKNGIVNNNIENICCLQVREHFFKLINLSDYLKNNNCNYKNLIFQIIHTLAVIQNKFNGFCHNNLTIKNIFLYLKKPNKSYSIYEGFNNNNYYLPNEGFDIKITNFENASIPNYYNKSNIINNDLHTFFTDLLPLISNNNENIIKFIKKVLSNKKNNLIDLLNNELFNEYSNNNKDQTKEIFFNSEYLTGFKVTIDSDNSSIFGKQTKIKKRYLKIQNAGSGEIIPHKKELSNPFVTNDEKNTFQKRKAEEVTKEPPVLLEQKIYDTSKPPKQDIPPPTLQINDKELSISYNPAPQPIQKIYNLNVSNPLNHSIINKIYEDILPSTSYNLSALTLFERSEIINFLRNSILDKEDGEETTEANSLLSWIKILDINPYSYNKNKYQNLAKNFLLYKAGYPIRYDEKTKNVVIGKNAMGLNVRMYMLTYGDISCETIDNTINNEYFDIWREIKYYDWIKTVIIKNKISPNFIAPILYKIDPNSKIDWFNIENLKNKNQLNLITNQLNINQTNINQIHGLKQRYGFLNEIIKKKINTNNNTNTNIDINDDITLYSGKTLLLLTEAPTTNILQWSSKMYNTIGSVKKMVATGYHPPNVWLSIFFQLVYAFSVLQKGKIYFSSFNLHDNIYIKDISYNPNNIGSWIYIVDNINYYIPNYGYILLLDSKFNNIDITDSLLKVNNNNQLFKIYSNTLFNYNSNYNIININKDIYNQFKSIINPDNFSTILKANGGSIPDESIHILLRKIYNDNEEDISKYILKYFSMFIHNRVGSDLTKLEVELVLNIGQTKLYKGDILPRLERNNKYNWVVFLESINTTQCNILQRKEISKDKYDYEIIVMNKSGLRRYPEKILPEFKNNLKYDENNIYETYNLDKL